MIADDLEVCIMHCNERVVSLCKSALKRQTLQPARIFEVQNISPLSAAYNEYYRLMKLKYVVKLDADVLLYPNALEKLYKAFSVMDHKEHYCMIGFVKDVIAGRSSGVRITHNSPQLRVISLPDKIACDRLEKWVMREMYGRHCAHIEDEIALHLSNWNGIDSIVRTFFNTGQKSTTLGDRKLKLLKQICMSWVETGDVEALIAMVAFCNGLFHRRFKEKNANYAKKSVEQMKRLVYTDRVIYNVQEKE